MGKMKPLRMLLLLVLLHSIELPSTAMLMAGSDGTKQAMAFNLVDVDKSSICGEPDRHESGFLNGLYYLFYQQDNGESSAFSPNTPVVLWLSGGPGCSGLVGALFEHGPCMFDDETSRFSYNPFKWNSIAHVIYVDEPRGTGFFASNTHNQWNESMVVQDLRGFLHEFFATHPLLAANDLYVFGESFAGHFAPDLVRFLLESEPSRWRPVLKGIGIGNGAVSERANVKSFEAFAHLNGFTMTPKLTQSVNSCLEFQGNCSSYDATSANAKQLLACQEHRQQCQAAMDQFLDIITQDFTYNEYNLKRKCMQKDPVGLCYEMSHLVNVVNLPNMLAYLGVPASSAWKLCASLSNDNLPFESSDSVAFALDHGIRVLVYAGDTDAVENWLCQDLWTREMAWQFQQEFATTGLRELRLPGNPKPVGSIRASHDLTFVRVFEAGHMVPRDQPQVALELLRAFIEKRTLAQ